MLDAPVESAADFHSRVEPLKAKFSQPETEDSWEIIAKNLKMLTDLCQDGGACEFSAELIAFLRSSSRPIINSLATERTRLSGVAIDLLSAVATGLGKSFRPLLQIFLPTLLSLCGRTNKVIITRSRACIMTIIETTQLPSILSFLLQVIEDKSSSIRFTAAEGTLMCMNCFNPPDLEKEARAIEVETVMRAAAKDAQADIRAVGRKLFEAYKIVLPHRVDNFTGHLSPTTKKYLDIKSSSNVRQEASHSNPINKLSSSTSGILSTHSRPESTNPTRSVSSALPTSRRTNPVPSKAPASTVRQKIEMPPPDFVPIRPPTRTISGSRTATTTGISTQRRVVSTTLPSKTDSMTKSDHSYRIPARPNSANSHRDGPQRLRPQLSVPALPGPSGPRRVRIPDAPAKTVETIANPTIRSRVASSSSDAVQPDLKALPNRPPQPVIPVREKHKPVPKVPAQVSVPSRSTTTTHTQMTKSSKFGSLTQPTLAQIARAKATTAERKHPPAAQPKKLLGRSAPAKGSSSTVNTSDRSKFRPTRNSSTAIKKEIQPATIPLPPSPTPSVNYGISDAEELSTIPLHAPKEDAPSNDPVHEEPTITTSNTVHEIETTPGEEPETEDSHQELEAVGENLERKDELMTPTITSGDTIFDTGAKTPISSLLSSIQRGFLMTPSSPLSPPQSYLDHGADVQSLPIPCPLMTEDEKVKQGSKPFMFGIGGEGYARSTLSNVENLNVHT